MGPCYSAFLAEFCSDYLVTSRDDFLSCLSGASVPSDYAFYDVPPDFVEYAPEYNGYKYIVVGDQILIIDPQTWEIAAVIPV